MHRYFFICSKTLGKYFFGQPTGRLLLKNFEQTSMLFIIICTEKINSKKLRLGVIDPVIGTLIPAWKCKQTWLLPNFVPIIVFTSPQFSAYEKREWRDVFYPGMKYLYWNILPVMPGSRLSPSFLAEAGWKPCGLHINATTNL